ncbi:MAG: NAD(P)/FAD-dependent oxidoreductase [Candidatus Omnitrophica bacterium]|nr:NAD(P)/FAD-dependent oxidoreductase [Candidatus Omnitrophota bacterium]MBU4457670.1 NAD(P)/FAD-dependent oxidoreductase [Candidatus Omnitrophota bacterium]
MKKFDAIIIGAGPAGMMAAIRAAERNRRSLLIERNHALGRKLLISGKGRCNLTNSCGIEDFLGKFSESRDFLRNAFARFFNTDLMSFFEDAGLRLKTERGGRVFPKSDRSEDILNVLKLKLKNKNIKILSGERVHEIIVRNKKIEGVLTYSGKNFLTSRIAITTGGLSYPGTGSTGDGYRIAEALGHKIVPSRPALSPIIIKERFIRDWQGISLRNIRLTLFSDGKRIDERFGEMLFTHFGLSGPLVLDISASIYDELKLKKCVTVAINFKPALDHKKMDARLLREFKANPRKNIKNIFKNILPQGIITRFLEYCCIDGNKNASQITAEERKRLTDGLFDLRLTVEGVMPAKDGIVTRGGVNTKEINPKTMESKLVKGLFFAGEVIDIDAKTGGYNMQAAFSTGWVCGDNI